MAAWKVKGYQQHMPCLLPTEDQPPPAGFEKAMLEHVWRLRSDGSAVSIEMIQNKTRLHARKQSIPAAHIKVSNGWTMRFLWQHKLLERRMMCQLLPSNTKKNCRFALVRDHLLMPRAKIKRQPEEPLCMWVLKVWRMTSDGAVVKNYQNNWQLKIAWHHWGRPCYGTTLLKLKLLKRRLKLQISRTQTPIWNECFLAKKIRLSLFP